MLLKKLLFLTVFALFTADLIAQDSSSVRSGTYDSKAARKDRISRLMKMEEEGDLIFDKAWLLGLRLSTDGYGIFYEHGKFKTVKKTSLFQIEFNEKKSQKDHKVAAAGFNGYNFNSVVIGKLNNFYQLKGAVGQQLLIGGKDNKNGVAVSIVYTGGVSIGLLKPYFVDAFTASAGPDSTFRSKYPTIIDSSYIPNGASGFFTGLNKISIKPGLNAKAALRFDYGRFNQGITAIEVGATAEYYFSKIPMLYLVPQKHLFLNAYLSIMFGKRK